LRGQEKVTKEKAARAGKTVFDMHFILSLADGPSLAHCQCAASCRLPFNDEMTYQSQTGNGE